MNPERAIGWLFALIVFIILIVVLFRILGDGNGDGINNAAALIARYAR